MSLAYLIYFLGCIVCTSNGSLNLIWFILAHVIIFCNSFPCLYALVGEIKFIYLFYLFIYRALALLESTPHPSAYEAPPCLCGHSGYERFNFDKFSNINEDPYQSQPSNAWLTVMVALFVYRGKFREVDAKPIFRDDFVYIHYRLRKI